MYHINISDLKRLAKKERKNNPSIKNISKTIIINIYKKTRKVFLQS